MSTIAYYVTDSGFGHLTRSLAIIKEILETTDHSIYLGCGKNHMEYASVYLIQYKDRLHMEEVKTEPGMTLFEDTFAIDETKTFESIVAFKKKYPSIVKAEVKKLKEIDVALVLTDFTIIGIEVAKKLGVKVVGLSNYTLYHRYQKMKFDIESITFLKDAYDKLDSFFAYAMHDDLSGLACEIKEVGFVARKVNKEASQDFQSRYWPSAFLSIGQVGKRRPIQLDFQAGHVYLTGNVEVLKGNTNVIRIPRRVGHSQDYINASSICIIKPGWSVVAECLIAGKPMGVLDVNRIEDGELIDMLVDDCRCFLLSDEDIDHVDIKALNIKSAGEKLEKVPNDVDKITADVLKFI